MKTALSFAAALLLTATAFAQNFEGTLTWTFRTEVSDPGMQQAMQQAQGMMANPEVQAQMQAAMSDPQVRAMMESNPQMKAMMEGRMGAMMGGRGGMAGAAAPAAAGGSDMLSSMMPKGMTLRTKGGNTHVVTEGGMAASEILTKAGNPESYLIDRAGRTYQVLSPGPAQPPSKSAPAYRVSRTNETTTILNYRAVKYVVEGGPAGAGSTMAIWTTTEIPGVDARQMSRVRLGEGDAAYLGQVEGVPVRLEMGMAGVKMTMELSAVRRESLSDDLFRLPAGFVERK